MTDDRSEIAVLQATIDRLRAEVEGLRTSMRTRGVIEQAKGVLAERLSCSPEEAFTHLVRLSQDANLKLTHIAAALLGIATPPDTDGRLGNPAAGPSTTPDAAPRARPSVAPVPRSDLSLDLAARFHLVSSALSAAEGPDDLARLLWEIALAPLGVRSVVLALLEPDGALATVGSHGLSPRQRSQWQRIPPQPAAPLTRAVQTGVAVWTADSDGAAMPGRTVCALPLRTGERLLGALAVGWDEPPERDGPTERYLAALARLTAARMLHGTAGWGVGTGPVEPAGEPWFRAVLDALLDPVLILDAVREPGGKVIDLRVGHANAATVDLAGRTGEDIIGRRVTELYPGMVASGAFQHLLDVAATGVPYEGGAEQFIEVVDGALHASTMTLHATPFLDGVLVSWRLHDEQERREHQLTQAQRLAGLGTWQWEVDAERLTCSSEVYRLLGRPAADRGELSLATAAAAVAPDDRPAVRRLAERLLAGHSPQKLEFRLVRQDGAVRSVRLMAEAVTGPDGEVPAVRGVVQDVTAWRRTERALSSTRDRLAEQRRQTAAEQRAVRALQHALLDAPRGPRTEGLELATRYLPAETAAKVGGDWYDALTLPDGTVLLVVGDVSGHGLAAAAGMAQLRHALRGMAYTGAEPAEILRRLNQMVWHQRSAYIATVICGLLRPERRTLSWARAGHLPPLLRHDGTARLLDPPAGVLLGATPDACYQPAELRLVPDDLLLFYTDGLVERRHDDLGAGLDRLVRAVGEYRAEGLNGCLDHVLRRLGAPNPQDDTCLLGFRLAARACDSLGGSRPG